MWRMLQQDEPEDYVVATGVTNTVGRLVELAFEHAGLDQDEHVRTDPSLIRPAEVDLLVGDAAKAREKLGLGLHGSTSSASCAMMVDADLERLSGPGPRRARERPAADLRGAAGARRALRGATDVRRARPPADDLTRHELRVFSQNGEDGVDRGDPAPRRHGAASFVEFGVEAGVEGNCVFLADVLGWPGLFMEATPTLRGARRPLRGPPGACAPSRPACGPRTSTR